jgi:hypothetical protein
MSIRRVFVTVACLGVLVCVARGASASPVCVVPLSTSIDVLPAGCAAVLTNGPVTYTGVVDTKGDLHNVTATSLILSNLNIPGSSATFEAVGTNTDVTSGGSLPFDQTITNFFQTTPLDNHYAADTGPQNFTIAHFINTFSPSVTLKLNFGESGRPGEMSRVTSSADTTTNPGLFTVSSFFDVFTELSLDGGAHWTVADNDFIPGSDRIGPGTHLELTAVPEPGTLTLAALGLSSLVTRMRRRASRRSAC